MKNISKLFKYKTVFSVGIFAGQGANIGADMYGTISKVSLVKPDFISISDNKNSLDNLYQMSLNVKRQYGIEPLSCVNIADLTNPQFELFLEGMAKADMLNIAIPSAEDSPAVIKFIKSYGKFHVTVVSSPDADDLEIEAMKVKTAVKAGAEVILTTPFFDNERFAVYREKLRAMNAKTPVHASIMPITDHSFESSGFAEKVHVSKKAMSLIHSYKQPKVLFDAGISYATEQIEGVLSGNLADGIHLCVNDNPYCAMHICEAISLLLMQ